MDNWDQSLMPLRYGAGHNKHITYTSAKYVHTKKSTVTVTVDATINDVTHYLSAQSQR